MHTYRCPVHGEFEVACEPDYIPDVVTCPMDSFCVAGDDVEYATEQEATDAALKMAACGTLPVQARAPIRQLRLHSQRCADDCSRVTAT